MSTPMAPKKKGNGRRIFLGVILASLITGGIIKGGRTSSPSSTTNSSDLTEPDEMPQGLAEQRYQEVHDRLAPGEPVDPVEKAAAIARYHEVARLIREGQERTAARKRNKAVKLQPTTRVSEGGPARISNS